MTDDLEILSYTKAEIVIQNDYINKVLAFMEGKSARVVSNKEYLKVYGVVMAQCDQQDNGALLYKLYL
jgi:hypothetical protein